MKTTNCSLNAVITLVVTAMLVGSNMARAQDDSFVCNGLLRHGVYDKFREIRSNAAASQILTHICEAYQKLQKDKVGGQAEGHYGLAGGEGSFSREQLESIGQFMCADSFSASSASNALTIIQEKISSAAMDAYRECVAQNSGGLKTKTVFREEDQGQVTVELRYVAPVGAPPQTTVNDIVVSPADSFTCRGSLWDVKGKANGVGTNAVAMSCERKIAKTPSVWGAASVLAPPSTITVMTTSGTLNRSVESISAGPPVTPLSIPLGTMIAFSGTMDEAKAQRQFGWWVCDGTLIDDQLANSAYKNRKTPDLSERFFKASTKAGDTGGAPSFQISPQIVKSHTTGAWGLPQINGDPFTHMQGPHSATTDNSIYSEGIWSDAVNVPIVPQFYSVIYLIKVK